MYRTQKCARAQWRDGRHRGRVFESFEGARDVGSQRGIGRCVCVRRLRGLDAGRTRRRSGPASARPGKRSRSDRAFGEHAARGGAQCQRDARAYAAAAARSQRGDSAGSGGAAGAPAAGRSALHTRTHAGYPCVGSVRHRSAKRGGERPDASAARQSRRILPAHARHVRASCRAGEPAVTLFTLRGSKNHTSSGFDVDEPQCEAYIVWEQISVLRRQPNFPCAS